jgi:hypothetical protein
MRQYRQVNMNINVKSVLTIVPDLIENHVLIFKVLPSADGTKSRVVLLGSQGQTRSSISSIIYSTMEF